MKQNQAIRFNGEDALVERMFEDYHAGRDEMCSMVLLRWADGHQSQHLLSEVRDADELYSLPYSQAQNQVNGEFGDLPWTERVKLAHRYFPAALALSSALGPLQQAGDHNPAALGAAFANATVLKQSWCGCKEHSSATDSYYCTEKGSHGWMCAKCHGITQVG